MKKTTPDVIFITSQKKPLVDFFNVNDMLISQIEWGELCTNKENTPHPPSETIIYVSFSGWEDGYHDDIMFIKKMIENVNTSIVWIEFCPADNLSINQISQKIEQQLHVLKMHGGMNSYALCGIGVGGGIAMFSFLNLPPDITSLCRSIYFISPTLDLMVRWKELDKYLRCDHQFRYTPLLFKLDLLMAGESKVTPRVYLSSNRRPEILIHLGVDDDKINEFSALITVLDKAKMKCKICVKVFDFNLQTGYSKNQQVNLTHLDEGVNFIKKT